jgi:hypothetical protein
MKKHGLVVHAVPPEALALMPTGGVRYPTLLLAAHRFKMPLAPVCWYATPFLLVLLGVVLLITHVPALTIGVGG